RIEADEELAHRLQAEETENTLKLKKQDCLQNISTRERDILPNKDLKKRGTSHPYKEEQYFVPMETEIRRGVPELVVDSSQAAVTVSTEAGGTKRVAEEELGQQSSKKQKSDELSQEELQQLMIIVLEEGMNIEALQTKYPIIDWEVYTKDSRMYWKIIRVSNHTEDGMYIYMLVEREYPLSRGVLTQMLVAKLLVEQDNKMSRELLRKIFMQEITPDQSTRAILDGKNVVPLRSNTIRLVQNRFSFHGLWFEDPNQHLKDFLKLVDSLDLNCDSRERMRLRLFQFSPRDQASNWLERLPEGSISTWEDLTTHFLTQFFSPGRLLNSIMTS
ncbi:zinc finger, CCHC-type containing protein, partial [Tanacetum coccineum]